MSALISPSPTPGLRATSLLSILQGLLLATLLALQQPAGEGTVALLPTGSGLLLAGLAPLLLLLGGLPASAIQRRWLAGATLGLLVIETHALWRASPASDTQSEWLLQLAPLTVLALASGHLLLQARQRTGSWALDYAALFDEAVQLAVRLISTGLFCGLLWAAIGITVGLLSVLDIRQPLYWLSSYWLWLPLLTLGVSLGLHVSSGYQSLASGLQHLLLRLLAGLLPVLVLLLLVVAACLPFTGVAPLLATGHASVLLTGAMLLLIALINAVHGASCPPQRASLSPLLQLSVRAGALLLPLMAALALTALAQRVEQYGWTSDRVWAALIQGLLALLSLGYALSALRSQAWVSGIARCNTLLLLAVLLLPLLLSNPLTDPARIAVDSQLRRLQQGQVAPRAFDYDWLVWQHTRYGDRAVHALATRHPQAMVRALAAQASGRHLALPLPPTAQARISLRDMVELYPAGKSWPAALLQTELDSDVAEALRPCRDISGKGCSAYMLDINGDSQDELLLRQHQWPNYNILLQQDSSHQWRVRGTLPELDCKAWQHLQAGASRPSQQAAIEINQENWPILPWGQHERECDE